jgi:hypothetical protein
MDAWTSKTRYKGESQCVSLSAEQPRRLPCAQLYMTVVRTASTQVCVKNAAQLDKRAPGPNTEEMMQEEREAWYDAETWRECCYWPSTMLNGKSRMLICESYAVVVYNSEITARCGRDWTVVAFQVHPRICLPFRLGLTHLTTP